MSRGWFRHIDWWVAVPAGILVFLSLVTLFSINTSFFINQSIFVIVSLGIFLFFQQVDIKNMRDLVLPLYSVSIIGLIIVFIVGMHTRGAIRWIPILGFQLQISEVLKPVFIFCLASFLESRKDISWRTFALALAFLSPVVFLIYKQPDLGNALIYLFVFLMTIIIYGFPLWWFAMLAGGVAIFIPFLSTLLHEYQRQRLFTFFHLSRDPLGNSYNAIQAIIAVGSGMFLGKGLGLGTQSSLRFLPERHTDFLFATLSEDLGFLGAFLVIAIFLFLLFRIFIIFQQTQEKSEKVFIIGAFFLLLIQFFVNVGMNVGLLPIVGVTLPFMSYGGSSLLSNAVLLGIVSSIAREGKYKHSILLQ